MLGMPPQRHTARAASAVRPSGTRCCGVLAQRETHSLSDRCSMQHNSELLLATHSTAVDCHDAPARLDNAQSWATDRSDDERVGDVQAISVLRMPYQGR